MEQKVTINRRDFLKTGLAGAAIASLGSCRLGPAESVTKKPNIIVIMADDISAREFPTYNVPNPTYGDGPCVTPVFERMKNQGVQFTHSWATPLCHPSRGMIMTGRYAQRTQWWSNEFGPVEGEKGYPLYDSHLTLGRIARNAGYLSQFIGKWQLGGTPDGYAFDEYVSTPGQYAARSPADKKSNSQGKGKSSFYWNPGYGLRNHPDYPDSLGAKGQTFKTTWSDFAADIELKFIKNLIKRKTEKDQPFFVYWPAHLGHPNWDFENDGMGYPGVPPMDKRVYPGTRRIKTTAPDGTVVEKTPAGINYHVQYLDYCLGELIKHTENLGIDKNTIIIFSTDNATTEYGKGLKGAVKEHGPKVPMLVYGPGLVKAHGQVDDLASLVDVAPTVAELTGAKLPDRYEFDGRSMVPFLAGKTAKHRDWLYSYNAEYQMVRTRNVVRDGLGFYWDARGILDQEQYRLIDEEKPDLELRKDIEIIKSVLKKYPAAPLSGPMYERYMKSKEGKRELWDKMREKIFSQNRKKRGK